MSKQSFDELVKAQSTLGTLGFTIDTTGYCKVYAVAGNGQVAIRPLFSEGISMNQTYTLSGFHVESYGIVPISENEPIQWDKFPAECVADISSIVASLAPGVFLGKKKAKYIITAECSHCAQRTESFLHMAGETYCLPCAAKLD